MSAAEDREAKKALADAVEKNRTPVPKAQYISRYDVTIWDYPDHLLLEYGDVRGRGLKTLSPIYITKVQKNEGIDVSLAAAFTAEVEVDMPGIDADAISADADRFKGAQEAADAAAAEESLY